MIVTFSILFIVGSTLMAQSNTETGQQKEQKVITSPAENDANANGILDVKENQQSGSKKSTKKRDQFIDVNGDGICDSRENGLGFRRGKGIQAGQSGKRQQGRHK